MAPKSTATVIQRTIVLRSVKRAGVTRVILVLNEYLEGLMRSKPVIRRIDVAKVRSKLNNREIVGLAVEWNRLVTLLE